MHNLKNLFLTVIFCGSYILGLNINVKSVVYNKVINKDSENTIQGYVLKSDSRIPLSGANIILI